MGLICTCKGEYSNGECIPCPDGTVYTWYGQCVACPNGQIEVDGVCKHGTHTGYLILKCILWIDSDR